MNEAELGPLETKYAELLVTTGVNLQPGQSLTVHAQAEHRPLVREIVAQAYRAGGKFVQVDWIDLPTVKQRYLYSRPEYLDEVPEYEVLRYRQLVNESWARLSLVGDEYPDALTDVDPERMRRASVARARKLQFAREASMANRFQWCVAGAPTAAWAAKVFPDLPEAEAIAQLWRLVLDTCRVNQPDPREAWLAHDYALKQAIGYLAGQAIRGLHFFDPTPGPDGKPATDLTIGLTDRPNWEGAGAKTPAGVLFFPNMPTEEIFSTPHRDRAQGWARISKPAFPFERPVHDAYFRFEAGEVVEAHSDSGQALLEQLFQMDGARRLGEVALVDVRSPVNQSGVVLHETLFDENVVCHIAFGQAYPGGIEGGDHMPREELYRLGMNKSDTHLDVMIGTPTMRVIGIRADGSETRIMENGQFVSAVVGDGV